MQLLGCRLDCSVSELSGSGKVTLSSGYMVAAANDLRFGTKAHLVGRDWMPVRFTACRSQMDRDLARSVFVMAHTTTRDRLNNRRPSRNGYTPKRYGIGTAVAFVLLAIALPFLPGGIASGPSCTEMLGNGSTDVPAAVACLDR